MHDIPGLIRLMGGEEKYNARLDEHFSGGHKVREIAASEYANLPSGIDGDDDCGQMSAWYLFTALGFYPVNPASGDYMLGSPPFSKMTLTLANGNHFTVSAENNSTKKVYIQSATLNGRPLAIPVISYDDIVAGASLKLMMGSTPSSWARDWAPSRLHRAAVQVPKD
jgi:putative alpha-1,2-mannosidase